MLEKLDGSLGILFYYNNQWHLATRGSFHSDQAIRGSEILKKYSLDYLHTDYTYLFEIIYPENRIVVDYQDREELVLLGEMDKSGKQTTVDIIYPFPSAKRYDFKDWKEIQKLNWKNSEGFIIRFCNGSRCKVKFEDYVRLHRILSNVSQKSVWELVCERKSLEEYLALIPDEFHNQVKGWYYKIIADYGAIDSRVKHEFDRVVRLLPQTFIADGDDEIIAKESEYKGMLFSLYDSKDIHDALCDLVKPSAAQPLIFDKE